jgi:hypothetical protein
MTSTLTAFALVGTMSAFAQEPAPARPGAQPGAPPQAEKETVTGCVVAAKTTDGATAYVLNEAEGGSAKLYVLADSPQPESPKSDWATNVNKKVEVTGPVQKPAAPPAEEAASQKVLRPPMVQVESVKVVADTCK